jgi:hypothetical protein
MYSLINLNNSLPSLLFCSCRRRICQIFAPSTAVESTYLPVLSSERLAQILSKLSQTQNVSFIFPLRVHCLFVCLLFQLNIDVEKCQLYISTFFNASYFESPLDFKQKMLDQLKFIPLLPANLLEPLADEIVNSACSGSISDSPSGAGEKSDQTSTGPGIFLLIYVVIY